MKIRYVGLDVYNNPVAIAFAAADPPVSGRS